jgi:hypothetical protein
MAVSLLAAINPTDAFDAAAGLMGAAASMSYQPRLPIRRWVPTLSVGVISALYGAPALAEWQHLSKATEYLCAAVIGLTAQAHIIPGILDAAAIISRFPSSWARKKLKDYSDEHSS